MRRKEVINLISKRELEVLNILFGSIEEMTSTDICNSKRELTQSTVIAVLRKLKNNGLVESVGITHSGKVLSQTYRPTHEAKASVIKYFLHELEDVKNIFSLEELVDAQKNSTR